MAITILLILSVILLGLQAGGVSLGRVSPGWVGLAVFVLTFLLRGVPM